nr:hypothetical protein GCM10020093_013190 [Planobispora longispora]
MGPGGLSRTAIKGWLTALVAAAALAAYFLGVNELAVLAAGGLIVMAARTAGSRTPGRGARAAGAAAGRAVRPGAAAGRAPLRRPRRRGWSTSS